jgi:NTE family protein
MKPEISEASSLAVGDDRLRVLSLAFPNVDPSVISQLASICSDLVVPGGQTIILEGEPSDAVYIVVTGMLAAYKRATDGREVLLNRMTRGATVGEIGFITDATRTATVRALRNSEVLRISKDELQRVTSRHPNVLLAICATVVQRLQHAQAEGERPPRLRTLCLLPVDTSFDAADVMRRMAQIFESLGTVTTVTAEQAVGRTSGWFAALEQAFDHVLFLADATRTAWTAFCLGQSDGIILLVRGDKSLAEPPPLALVRATSVPLFVMLLWHHAIGPGQAEKWLGHVQPKAHFHIRSDRDLARAARLIAGRGVGLVLSGGGARGLAHVGVLNALTQNDVPVDVIGGTSIGGIVAGLYAFEWDLETMARSLVTAFSRRRISDFAVPRTALFSMRSFARIFEWLGDTRMEDAPIPVFCVSTNLTEGVPAVHRTGRMETWFRATAAIPGIFPPVIEGGSVHVDGGVLNNMPVDIIWGFGVSCVIAVDVGAIRQSEVVGKEYLSLMELLWRVGTIGDGAGASAGRRRADVILRPAIAKVGLFGWGARDDAIAAGEQVVREHLQEIRAAVARRSRNDELSLTPKPGASRLASPDTASRL